MSYILSLSLGFVSLCFPNQVTSENTDSSTDNLTILVYETIPVCGNTQSFLVFNRHSDTCVLPPFYFSMIKRDIKKKKFYL